MENVDDLTWADVTGPRGSPVVALLWFLHKLVRAFCLLKWVRRIRNRLIGRVENLPKWVIDIWALLLLTIELVVLFLLCRYSRFCLFVALLGLIDALGVVLNDMMMPTMRDREIPVRSVTRWLALSFVTIGEVVACFAILFLRYADAFLNGPGTPLAALYQSTLTLTTLGYGDITPEPGHSIGYWIVVAELAFFLVLLLVRLPLAMSAMKLTPREGPGDAGGTRSASPPDHTPSVGDE